MPFEEIRLGISDPWTFLKIFQGISRSAELAYLSISNEGLTISSIDSQDMGYAVARFYPRFMQGQLRNFSASVNLSNVNRILPSLRNSDKMMWLSLEDGMMKLSRSNGETLSLELERMNGQKIPKPQSFNYEGIAELQTAEFTTLIDRCSLLSKEVTIRLSRASLSLESKAKGNSYKAKVASAQIIKSSVPVKTKIQVNYLKSLVSVLRQSEVMRIFLGAEKPLQIRLSNPNMTEVSLFLSTEKNGKSNGGGLGKPSIPNIRESKFPDYLLRLDDGNKDRALQKSFSGLDGTIGLYFESLAMKLGLTEKRSERVQLTKYGKNVTTLLRSSENHAKDVLKEEMRSTIPAYKAIVESIDTRSMSPNGVQTSANAKLALENHPRMEVNEFYLLLGLATWCGHIDRRFDLRYFAK